MANETIQNQPLRLDNPYSIGSVFVFDEGDFLLDGEVPQFINSPRDRYYTVKQGDDLWSIAFQAYGNSKWWWLIFYANDMDFGLDLKVGKTILIPDLITAKLNL